MARNLPTAQLLQLSVFAQQVALDEIVKRARAEKKSIDDYRFRVGLNSGGCSGFSYFVRVEDTFEDDDQLFNIGDLAVVVDKLSVLYLAGTFVDYVDTAMEKKFTFNSPNSKNSCGCGLSVDFK